MSKYIKNILKNGFIIQASFIVVLTGLIASLLANQYWALKEEFLSKQIELSKSSNEQKKGVVSEPSIAPTPNSSPSPILTPKQLVPIQLPIAGGGSTTKYCFPDKANEISSASEQIIRLYNSYTQCVETVKESAVISITRCLEYSDQIPEKAKNLKLLTEKYCP